MTVLQASLSICKHHAGRDQNGGYAFAPKIAGRLILPPEFWEKHGEQYAEGKHEQGGGGQKCRYQRHRCEERGVPDGQTATEIDQLIGGVDADHGTGTLPEEPHELLVMSRNKKDGCSK